MILLRNILLLVVLLWSLPGISAAQSPSVMMSAEDLAILEQNCTASEAALQQSLIALEEAKALLTESEQELMELTAKLNESEEICIELRQTLATLRTESAKLKSELALLKAASVKASTDLAKAEKSLQDTEQAYKKDHKKQVRKTRLWQVIAVILGGVALGK